VSEGGANSEQFEPNLQTTVWVSVATDGDVLAIISFEKFNSVTLQVHPAVVPEHRQHSRKIIAAAAEWVNNTPSHYKKMIAEIPTKLKHVCKFAQWAGFELEGVRKSSFIKDEQLLDVNLYGITLEDLKKRF